MFACTVVLWVAGALMSAARAENAARIGSRSVTAYRIVYDPATEAEEGFDAARYARQLLQDSAGVSLGIVGSKEWRRGSAIRLRPDNALAPFGYRIGFEGRSLVVSAGGCWAMQKAARVVAGQLRREGCIPARFLSEGTVEGEHLFPLAEGANLRILDDNIWDYSSDAIPEAWLPIGVDPRDDVRAPQFAQLVRAYMPDVVTLQEYSRHMHDRFWSCIRQYGYVASYESGDVWDNTPIFYNPATLEQLSANYHLYTPERWSNEGSKSFTSAVFRHKATGQVFAVITTHLWFKNNKVQPGSTQARAAQVRLLLAEAEVIRAEHHCPVFVTGDMNCYESSLPMRQFFDEGYEPCYRLATEYADLHNGHHICSPKDGFSRESRRRSPERQEGAIDHCLLLDPRRRVEVKRFDCVQARFTVMLTDHYPNLIDAAL